MFQKHALPISVPALQPPCPSTSSRLRILKELRGVDPGWVEIIPLKRVTVHVRTWLLSAQTGTHEQFQQCCNENGARDRGHARTRPEIRCFSDSMILVTGLRWTEKVWKSCGPEPTVSGCWTMTRTDPELVPYAISIQFPLSPGHMIICEDSRFILIVLSYY